MSNIQGTQANYGQKPVPLSKQNAPIKNVAAEQLRPKGTPAVSSADVPKTVQSGGLSR